MSAGLVSELDVANMEDEVVFLQPVGGVGLGVIRFDVGLDQRGRGEFELLLDDARGQSFEVGVGGPAGGKLDERVPVAGERQLEDQADDAVIVILDLALEALAAVEDERVEAFFDGRTLVADVSGSLMLEAGFGGAGAEDLAEFVEADLFADVELDQDQDRAAQGAIDPWSAAAGRVVAARSRLMTWWSRDRMT
jgi:hypothetical protein